MRVQTVTAPSPRQRLPSAGLAAFIQHFRTSRQMTG